MSPSLATLRRPALLATLILLGGQFPVNQATSFEPLRPMVTQSAPIPPPASPHTVKDDPIPPVNPPVALVVPKAIVAGPSEAVPIKGAAYFDARPSVSDYPLVWTITPDLPILTFDKDGKRARYGIIPMTTSTFDTTYILTVQALGKQVNGDPIADAAILVFKTEPKPVAPTVDPNVTPTPNPPGPGPGPIPVAPLVPPAATIFAILFYPPNEPTTSVLRSESDVASQLKGLNAKWRAYPDSERKIDPATGQLRTTTYLQDLGLASYYKGGPTLFLYTKDWIGAESVIAPCPNTPEAVVSLVKKFRGMP